jgi:nucleotide-binding universal stress UspA family protein
VRIVVWLTEAGWEAAVDAALQLSADADVTLLYVADQDVASSAEGALSGLLGRRANRVVEAITRTATETAEEILASAQERLGRPAEQRQEQGAPELVVMEAARQADVLVLGRSNRKHGPKSISRPMRYVVDHAPGLLVMAWPGGGPEGPAPAPPPHVTGEGPPPPPLPHERDEDDAPPPAGR